MQGFYFNVDEHNTFCNAPQNNMYTKADLFNCKWFKLKIISNRRIRGAKGDLFYKRTDRFLKN